MEKVKKKNTKKQHQQMTVKVYERNKYCLGIIKVAKYKQSVTLTSLYDIIPIKQYYKIQRKQRMAFFVNIVDSRV
jgi:hypothetical protein